MEFELQQKCRARCARQISDNQLLELLDDAAIKTLEVAIEFSFHNRHEAVKTDYIDNRHGENSRIGKINDRAQVGRSADATLVGAVGGPEWDGLGRDGPIAESDGLTRLRIELDVYNALRPVRAWQALHHRTPFRPEIIDGADILVIRENSGGIYYGEPRGRETGPKGEVRAFEISEYRVSEIERIARCTFEAARDRRGKLVSLDKSHVMETGMLWREKVARIGRDEYPEVELRHLLMDYALFAVTCAPRDFDVVLADNLFGDLISDMIGALAGSLGMLPSATLPAAVKAGERIVGGVFEPSHGSAPDIAGKGIANPMGTILSVAMMFKYAFARADLAMAIEQAVGAVLHAGTLPPTWVVMPAPPRSPPPLSIIFD